MCKSDADIKEIISTITQGKCGLVIVVDGTSIQGIITDGDIRRAMGNRESDFFDLLAKDIMSKNPKTIKQDEKLTTANEIMNNLKVNSLIVVDDNNLLSGVVQVYDLGL